MIVLRDCVEIPAPPEVVWDWLEHLPDHILEWHPDHLGARWVRASGFVPGAVMEVRELLHGESDAPRRARSWRSSVDSRPDRAC